MEPVGRGGRRGYHRISPYLQFFGRVPSHVRDSCDWWVLEGLGLVNLDLARRSFASCRIGPSGLRRFLGRMRRDLAHGLLRFLLGGGIVSLAVLASQVAGPIIGAIPAAFPGISTSTMYELNKSQGAE